MIYTVKTRDVDGSAPARKYKTLAAACARFVEMAGGTIDGWIAEQFYERADRGEALPKIEEIRCLRAVSNYGTVVVLTKVE